MALWSVDAMIAYFAKICKVMRVQIIVDVMKLNKHILSIYIKFDSNDFYSISQLDLCYSSDCNTDTNT